MKNSLFSGLAGAALAATPVLAADLPIKARPPVVAVYNWTGCYVGSTVGGEWGRSQQTSAASGTGLASYGGVVNNLTGAPATIAAPTNGLPAGTYPFAISFVPANVTNAVAIGTNFTGPGSTIKTNGYMSGGEVGCQYQNGNFLIGVEGDGSWVSGRGDAPEVDGFNSRGATAWNITPGPTVSAATPTTLTGFLAGTQQKWLATARVRAGFTFSENRGLVYVTGGGAWGGIRVSDVFIGTSTVCPAGTAPNGTCALGVAVANYDTRTMAGWTIGGGLEWVLLGPLTAKIEYLYVDLGTKLFFGGSTDPFLPRNVTFREHVVRIGANYRFTP